MKELMENIKKTFELRGLAITSVQFCPDDGVFVIEGIAADGVFTRKILVQYLVAG
jgi:hypothetical protein